MRLSEKNEPFKKKRFEIYRAPPSDPVTTLNISIYHISYIYVYRDMYNTIFLKDLCASIFRVRSDTDLQLLSKRRARQNSFYKIRERSQIT